MKHTIFVSNYFNFLRENVRQSFLDAALRWNCDYVEITEHKFPVIYHPGAVKLTAFTLCPEADRILIIDADAVIAQSCPSPFDQFEGKSFVVVKNQQAHFPPMYLRVNPDLMNEDLMRIYERYPRLETFDLSGFFNTGVVLADRSCQAAFDHALDIFLHTPQLQFLDQSPLNYAMALSGIEITYAEPTWNYQFPRVGQIMSQYIYHFAGLPNRYAVLETINWKEQL